MKLVGAGGQRVLHEMYDVSGTIVAGGTAQLLLPVMPTRGFLMIQNNSTGAMYVEFGSARATATLTNGVITSFTITNAGFNFTKPPTVSIEGGGYQDSNTAFVVPTVPVAGYAPPTNATGGSPATAIASVSGGAVNAITLTNGGGAKYQQPPLVMLRNSELDPNGVAIASATSGMQLSPNGGNIWFNGTMCPTDAISIFSATTGAAFVCKYMT